MSIFDQDEKDVEQFSEIEHVDGSLERQDDEDKISNTVTSANKDEIDEGRLIAESLNHGIRSFNPDIMFRNLVNNYQRADRLYGETVIRELTGYNPNFVQKNVNIPEFRKELKHSIASRVDQLKEQQLVDDEGTITDDAINLSSVIMYLEELDKLVLRGQGTTEDRRRDPHGSKAGVKRFGNERYRNFAVRKSVKQALRRGHIDIHAEDMKAHIRRREGRVSLIYAMDSSGSMRGDKIGMAKKAGVALAYKAIEEQNEVGLITFGADVKESIAPCMDFKRLSQALASATAGRETNIAATVQEAVELFPDRQVTKHLMLITDALPTKGVKPVEDALEAVASTRAHGITVSLLGINLNDEGEELAQQIVEVGEGKLYSINEVGEMDAIVLADYDAFA